MTVELIVIGKTDSKEIAALVEMYARRVNFYCKFAVTALPDVRNTRNLTVKQQRTAEGEATATTSYCSTSGARRCARWNSPTGFRNG